MPVYKDEKRGSWYTTFYYTDWKGKKIKKKKRGFKTKKEAQQWEREFKLSAEFSLDMTLKNFVEVYFLDKENELSNRSIYNKRKMIERHVIPFLGDKSMNKITPADILHWQKEMLKNDYKPTYLRMIQNQVTALFTHASKIYDLKNNPCKKVKKIGKSDAEEKDFWTEDEYNQFLSTIKPDSKYHLLYELFFWTGAREGEVLALTKRDIDFEKKQIHITKSLYRRDKTDFVTTPKTEASVRVIEIPEFLTREIEEYVNRMYKFPDDERLFPISPRAIQTRFQDHIKKAGVKKITIHCLRHSHSSWMAHQGVSALLMKDRLGHANIKTTLDIYSHVYPEQHREVADMLDKKRKGLDSGNYQDPMTAQEESKAIVSSQDNYSKDSGIRQQKDEKGGAYGRKKNARKERDR